MLVISVASVAPVTLGFEPYTRARTTSVDCLQALPRTMLVQHPLRQAGPYYLWLHTRLSFNQLTETCGHMFQACLASG